MSYNLEIRPDALADIAEAATWYEAREPRLGVEFVRAIRESIDSLQANPLIYRLRNAAGTSAGSCHRAFLFESSTASRVNSSPSLQSLHAARHDRSWKART